MSPKEALWRPSAERSGAANPTRFLHWLREKNVASLTHWHELYNWSVQNPEKFWEALWQFCGIITHTPYHSILEHPRSMPGARWFPGARLNFAEHLLRDRGEGTAIIFHGEDKVRREISRQELFNAVAAFAAQLKKWGIQPGDVIAGVLPNMPEAIIGMLAATSCGAVWSSCSPDFGVEGILDRFGQIAPKVLLAPDGYWHKGKAFPVLDKIKTCLHSLPSVTQLVIVPYLEPLPAFDTIPEATLFGSWDHPLPTAVEFTPLPFDHPLYIMFSSGTTGKPKCIVHSAGGTLLEHLKELVLHTNLKKDDRIFYQTTCGWMMWNWVVSSLATGATLVLYDGAPFYHDGKILWEIAEQEKISIFGTNAKYIAALEKEGITPRTSFNLAALHTILSTGSPLLAENFDYIYRDVKSDVCLSSISGGTDILGCFALGAPLLPVFRGELQCRSLGLKVEVFNEQGLPVREEKGELVCTAPFPSMPTGFFNDSDGARYRAAYFERFPGVWHHGDFVELTTHDGLIVYGRSDTVLNPGGIRIGTAEIYRQVEKVSEVLESVAVGREKDGDVEILLFVCLREGVLLTDELRKKIQKAIREHTTAFHVPKEIFAVKDIPRTRSGKIAELAVRDVIAGKVVSNREALANPEALNEFLPSLSSRAKPRDLG